MTEYVIKGQILERLKANLNVDDEMNRLLSYKDGVIDSITAVEEWCTEDVEPVRRGRWLQVKHHFECDKCGYKSAFQTNFCSQCGANMNDL